MLTQALSNFFTDISHKVATVTPALKQLIFFDVIPGSVQFPFVIFMIFVSCVFFMFYTGFVNIRFFVKSFEVLYNSKYNKEQDIIAEGTNKISTKSAFFTGIAGAVGLGSISGVAAAVTTGGIGAILWFVICGFLSMPLRFAEVLLGHKYRSTKMVVVKDPKTGESMETEDVTECGPMAYMKYGFENLGFVKIAKYLPLVFAFVFVLSSFGGPSSFQINQTAVVIKEFFFRDSTSPLLMPAISFAFCFFTILVIFGGLKRIAKTAEILVKWMSLLYVLSILAILFIGIKNIPSSVQLIFSEAFSLKAGIGGFIGTFVAAFTRAAMSSEVGLGSVPMVHGRSANHSSVLEGIYSMSGPVFVNVIFCFLNGLAIVITGSYLTGAEGIIMVKQAFDTVHPYFSITLTLTAILFCFTTVISWYYYGENSINTLFKGRGIKIYKSLYILSAFLGGIVSFSVVLDILDLLLFAVAIPNLFAILVLAKSVKQSLTDYLAAQKENGV